MDDDMSAIVNEMIIEDNICRLVYRLIRRFGKMDIKLLAVLTGYALQQIYPDRCPTIEEALVYMTLQYRTNLQVLLATLHSHGYLEIMKTGTILEYKVIK